MIGVFELDFARLSEAADEADERAADERWARIRAVAAAISEADLSHETDVVKCLYAARFVWADFAHGVLDEAIQLAREARHSHGKRRV